MRRRSFIAAGGSLVAGSVAGCTGGRGTAVPTAEPAWSREVDTKLNDEPAVAGDRVYLAHDGEAVALNRDDGSVETRFSFIARQCWIADGWVLLAADHEDSQRPGRRLHALPAGASRPVWSVPEVLRTPRVAGGAVVVVRYEALRAVGLADGNFRWETSFENGFAVGAVSPGHVYGTSEPDDVTRNWQALDMSSGEVVWTQGEFSSSQLPTAAVAEGLVVVEARGDGTPDRLHALNRADGTVVWEYGFDDDVQVWVSDLVEGTLYVETESDRTHALDPTNGDHLWDGDGEFRAAVGGTVVTRGDRTVYGLAGSDGTERWSVDPPTGGTSANPEMAVFASDDRVTVITAEGLSVYDPRSGELQWRRRFDVGDPRTATVTAGRAYVPTDDALHAIALP